MEIYFILKTILEFCVPLVVIALILIIGIAKYLWTKIKESEKKDETISNMPGICKYCVGCLRLEDENFKSRYRCKDFEANQVNWEELIKNELEKN